MWPFRRKKTGFFPTILAKKGVKKVDKIATGVVLGGILASIYGYKAWSKHQLDHEAPTTERKPWYKRLFGRNKS